MAAGPFPFCLLYSVLTIPEAVPRQLTETGRMGGPRAIGLTGSFLAHHPGQST